MTALAFDFGILWPAFIAGLLVTATHVPLGLQVLNRGIVFIDLTIAQVAGLGVIFAHWLGFEPQGWPAQVAALLAALAGAMLLAWTEKRWPEVQEAIIGTGFVVAASIALLLLAADAHGGEHLKELLVGQILWVRPDWLPFVAIAYTPILFVCLHRGERIGRPGFYLLFACAVTVSVQLVGLYLVFTTLIAPALATRRIARRRLAVGYVVGGSGYAVGLVLSVVADWPAGPTIVCVMAAIAATVFGVTARRLPARA
jgi:zinc/manganese transport system permease protein